MRSEPQYRSHRGVYPASWGPRAPLTRWVAANRYLAEVYRPAFDAELMQPTRTGGPAYVPWIGCYFNDTRFEVYERVVGTVNGVAFEGIALQ